MTQITELTFQEIINSLQSGEISSHQLTKAYLKRIEKLEEDIHAFITITEEQALTQADKADKRFAVWRKDKTQPISPLLGVPLAVKDVLTVHNIRCTAGSKILGNFVSPYNATVVDQLLDAGMVILGKTNTDEFAMGSSTENSAYGVTHNPWDLSRVPGGSSGGSAAAVVANMTPIALGTDTGGSIRQPASFCGVTGLKPTYGRVSRFGLIAYGSSLDSAGAIARAAADIALLFPMMSGFDPKDSTSVNIPIERINLQDNIMPAQLRLGIPKEYFTSGIQPEVEIAIRKAINVLESLGIEIKEVNLPHTKYALPVYYLIAPAEASANLARYDGIRYGSRVDSTEMWDIFRKTRGTLFGAEVKRRIMLGTYALSAGYYDEYYGKAQKVRTLIKEDFDNVFKTVDLIAAPVSPTTAFKIGAHRDDPLAMYLEDIFTLPANLAGIPGITFPVGFDSHCLPIGIQLMGAPFQEEKLIRTAHAYQMVTDWHTRKPIPN